MSFERATVSLDRGRAVDVLEAAPAGPPALEEEEDDRGAVPVERADDPPAALAADSSPDCSDRYAMQASARRTSTASEATRTGETCLRCDRRRRRFHRSSTLASVPLPERLLLLLVLLVDAAEVGSSRRRCWLRARRTS